MRQTVAFATAVVLVELVFLGSTPGLLAQPASRPAPHSALSKSRARAANPGPHLAPLNEQERALQMLDRFTFGPRPGDLSVVVGMGADAWFEQQLNPDAVPDAALDKRLADFPGLRLPVNQLIVDYPTGQILKQIVEAKRPMPQDPTLGAVYEVLVAKYEKQQQ